MNIEEINKSKEIRKEILETLYNHRQDGLIPIGKFQDELKARSLNIDDRALHGEIIYLKEKWLLELGAEFCGKEYLNFAFLKITSQGIDLVEDPEEFGKLFSIKINNNSFRDVSNSNVNIDSNNVQQIINNETDPDLKLKLEELQGALNEGDKSKIMSILGYIGDKSVDVLIAILTSGYFNKS
jgi:hypothetical protein